MAILLRELRVSDERVAVMAHGEFPEWEFLLAYNSGEDWSEYVARCSKMRQGIDLTSGWVPATFFIAELDGEIIGRCSIRHELNEFLLNYGGHIGYGVRPPFRGRGYAKEILRQSLIYARELGISEVLMTCFDTNTASAAVIESQGGTLENIVEFDGQLLRRYWISESGRLD